jgi:hypothetical protein
MYSAYTGINRTTIESEEMTNSTLLNKEEGK